MTNKNKSLHLQAVLRIRGRSEQDSRESPLVELSDLKIIENIRLKVTNLTAFRNYFEQALEYAEIAKNNDDPKHKAFYNSHAFKFYSMARTISHSIKDDLTINALKYFEHKYATGIKHL